MAFRRLFTTFRDKHLEDVWHELNRRIEAAFAAGGIDQLVKVQASDTTAGYLAGKLVSGANVTLTLLNPGGNEQMQIDATGGGEGGGCNSESGWSTIAEARVEALPSLVPDVVLTDTASGALQTAIDSLASGQVLEVRTDATYDPITLPAVAGGYVVKAGDGYTPKITGQECVKLANGAQDVTFSGFELFSATSPVANSRGAFISFAAEFSLVERIIFADLYVHDVVGIAPGVMLSYFWNLYATPPNPATEMSSKLAFIDCNFVNAADWEIEGAALNVRGFDQTFITRCTFDGGNQTTRQVQLQNCFNSLIEDCLAFNVAAGNGGEAFKLDQLGAWQSTYGAWSTGIIRRCIAHDVAQGFDIDDYVAAHVYGCTAYNCAEEGFDLDNDSYGVFECCSAYNNVDGFRFEPGCKGTLRACMAFDNSSNDYRMDNGYVPDVTNEPRQDQQGGVGGRARVSLTDNTEGFLATKLVAGSNVTLTPQNVGGNETLRVDAAGGGVDQLVKVQVTDTTPSYLASKLVAGTNVTLTPQNVGGNETLRVDAAGGGGAVTWANFVFVGKDGNDGTGVRNSLTNKFLTVQAALNAALAGDVVFVGPGVYTENITWPSVDNITLTSKWGATIVGADGSVPVIEYSGTHNLQGMYITDIQIEQVDPVEGSPAYAIKVDGSNVPNLTIFDTLPLLLWRCLVISRARTRLALHLIATGDVLVRDSLILGQQTISQFDYVGYQEVNHEGTLEVYYLSGVAHPSGAEGAVDLHHCEVDRIEPHNEAHVRAYYVDVQSIFSNDLSDTDVPELRAGHVRLYHCVWNELDLGGAFAFVIPPTICEGYNCHSGLLTRIAGIGTEAYPVGVFRDCDFNQLIADGAYIDANQCHLQQGQTSAPNSGAIDRDVWWLQNVSVAASPGAAYAGPWIPYVNGGLTASAMVYTALGAVEFPAGVNPFGFTVGGSVAGAPGPVLADITIIQTK